MPWKAGLEYCLFLIKQHIYLYNKDTRLTPSHLKKFATKSASNSPIRLEKVVVLFRRRVYSEIPKLLIACVRKFCQGHGQGQGQVFQASREGQNSSSRLKEDKESQ